MGTPVGGHHLAQVNVAVPLEPMDSQRLRGFVEMLVPVNAVADAAPGFVWRLQTEDGDATALRPFPDQPDLMINMSVWESIDALSAYIYGPEHAAVMRQRRRWFVHLRDAIAAAWWIPAGTLPTVSDAAARIDLLRRLGPTPDAFTLQRSFPPPGAADDGVPRLDPRHCLA